MKPRTLVEFLLWPIRAYRHRVITARMQKFAVALEAMGRTSTVTAYDMRVIELRLREMATTIPTGEPNLSNPTPTDTTPPKERETP